MPDNHAPTLFPRITLDLEAICKIEPLPGNDGLEAAGDGLAGKSILSWGYAIRTPGAYQRAQEIGMNLDDYFSAQIAAYLDGMRNRKAPILVWYANINNLVLLYITSKRDCRWMTIENSFDGHTYGPIFFQNATPFVYLDGNGKISRVYFCPAKTKHRNLLFDMGCFSPDRVGNTSRERYDEIVESPTDDDNMYYSPIPKEREFVAAWKGRNIAMERAFCRISYRGYIFPHN